MRMGCGKLACCGVLGFSWKGAHLRSKQMHWGPCVGSGPWSAHVPAQARAWQLAHGTTCSLQGGIVQGSRTRWRTELLQKSYWAMPDINHPPGFDPERALSAHFAAHPTHLPALSVLACAVQQGAGPWGEPLGPSIFEINRNCSTDDLLYVAVLPLAYMQRAHAAYMKEVLQVDHVLDVLLRVDVDAGYAYRFKVLKCTGRPNMCVVLHYLADTQTIRSRSREFQQYGLITLPAAGNAPGQFTIDLRPFRSCFAPSPDRCAGQILTKENPCTSEEQGQGGHRPATRVQGIPTTCPGQDGSNKVLEEIEAGNAAARASKALRKHGAAATLRRASATVADERNDKPRGPSPKLPDGRKPVTASPAVAMEGRWPKRGNRNARTQKDTRRQEPPDRELAFLTELSKNLVRDEPQTVEDVVEMKRPTPSQIARRLRKHLRQACAPHNEEARGFTSAGRHAPNITSSMFRPHY